jgi:hypothetical protein
MENSEEGCSSMPQGNTGGMVVMVVAGARDSRAFRRAQRDAICWPRSASALVMGSSSSVGGTFGYLSPSSEPGISNTRFMVVAQVEREIGAVRRPCPRPSKGEGFFF